MSLEDEDNYQNSNDCCICNQKIINNKDKKIVYILSVKKYLEDYLLFFII